MWQQLKGNYCKFPLDGQTWKMLWFLWDQGGGGLKKGILDPGIPTFSRFVVGMVMYSGRMLLGKLPGNCPLTSAIIQPTHIGIKENNWSKQMLCFKVSNFFRFSWSQNKSVQCNAMQWSSQWIFLTYWPNLIKYECGEINSNMLLNPISKYTYLPMNMCFSENLNR